MSEAVIFFNDKKIFILDKNSNSELSNSFKIDTYNRFVAERLLDFIKSKVINNNADISAVITDSVDGILVPSDIYNSQKKEAFYTLNYSKIDAGKILLEEEISSINATMIYSCKKWFHDFVHEHLGPISISNSTTSFLRKILAQKDSGNMHLVIKESTFDLIKLQDKTLLSFNVIEYSTMTDIVYFLIAHLNKLDTKDIAIQVFGSEIQIKELEKIKNKILTLNETNIVFKPHTEFLQFIK